MDAMKAGKHVLCEKLMAWNIKQCKEMIKLAEDQRTGCCRSAISAITACSTPTPTTSSSPACWATSATSAPSGIATTSAAARRQSAGTHGTVDGRRIPIYRDSWRPRSPRTISTSQGHRRRARLEERQRTGALAALPRDRAAGSWPSWAAISSTPAASSSAKRRSQPCIRSVTAVGGKHSTRTTARSRTTSTAPSSFPARITTTNPPGVSRCPGQRQHNDIVTVTYSSINTNDFEPYGECVMGSKGTLIVEREEAAYLFGQGRGPRPCRWRRGGARC